MENESPIPSSFTVSIANFYERENITEPSIVEQIQMKIAGKKPGMYFMWMIKKQCSSSSVQCPGTWMFSIHRFASQYNDDSDWFSIFKTGHFCKWSLFIIESSILQMTHFGDSCIVQMSCKTVLPGLHDETTKGKNSKLSCVEIHQHTCAITSGNTLL